MLSDFFNRTTASIFRLRTSVMRLSSFCRKFLFSIVLFGAATQAQAGLFCVADFGGILDGSDPTTVAAMAGITQISIDGNCTIKNWDPLTVTINFTGPAPGEPLVYLVVFDNVIFDGNLSCSNVDHKLWFVNGSDYGSKNNCQTLFIPVETIDKRVPTGKTTVGIGESFTYSLTLPYMQAPIGDPSPNDLYNVILQDDVTSIATGIAGAAGAELTITGYTLTKVAGSGATVPVMTNDALSQAQCGINTSKNLCLKITDLLYKGDQFRLDITVVVDNVAGNTTGVQFANTAKWWYGREIDVDGNGTIDPWEIYTPLPGESGFSEVLTIAVPNLVMNKSSTESVVNLNQTVPYTLDVQNIGGSTAFNATIIDNIPVNTGNGGMCLTDPTLAPSPPITATIYAADGTTVVNNLTAGVDYSVTWNDIAATPKCQLKFVMLTNTAAIGPTQRLIITYSATHDGLPATDGSALTNYAGATEWFSGDIASQRTQFTGNVTDGTTATLDNQDAYSIIQGLTGYYFQKTVDNVTSGQSPALIAAPGDVVHYRLRVFNVDSSINIQDPLITDTLDPTMFNVGLGISNVVIPAGAGYTFDTLTGALVVTSPAAPNNVIGAGVDYVVEFDIQLAYTLNNADIVSNQARLQGSPSYDVLSDDPSNGIVNLGDPLAPPPDTTDITIQAPGALTKVLNPVVTNRTIGETVTYRITVPGVAVAVPIYDVRVRDNVSAAAIGADLELVSASATLETAGTSWTLTNSGTTTDLNLGDSISGVDIPAGDRAFVDITLRVSNTLNNQALDQFTNSAYFLYNRTDGNSATQTSGASGNSAAVNVVEANIVSVIKTVNNATPTPGDIIQYTVKMTANAGAGYSDVFDATLLDRLDLGLQYVPGTATVDTGNGAAISLDNTITDPLQLGDGVTTAQTLLWTVNEADIDIQAGATVTVTYQVLVGSNVLANQTLNNSVEVLWTGIDGLDIYERDGADGIGGLNDYIFAPQSVAVTTPNISATVAKTSSLDTYAGGGAANEVRVGDIVEYSLNISIPHGTLGNVTLVDTLPQGLQFEAIRSINAYATSPFVAQAPFTHNDITQAGNVVVAGDPTTGPSTVTWSLGNINNGPAGANPATFEIKYLARVLNNSVLAQADTTDLNNSVALSYDTFGPVTVNATPANYTVSVKQPNLSVAKSATTATSDIFVDPGEVVTYTVDVTNNGTAPAYDPVIQDTIPAGLRTAGISMVSAQLLVAGTNYLPPPAPTTYTAATGFTEWNLDTGVIDEYTIPAGDTLRLVYTVTADASIAAGLVLTNTALVNTYYSFDNDLPPQLDAVLGARQQYGPTPSASTTLYTVSLPQKSLLTAPAEATIGEEIRYQILVPGTATNFDMFDVHVTDLVDSNLEITAVTVTGVAGVTDASSATQVDLNITSIAALQQATIEVRARVRNVLGAQQGTAINNTASYNYALTSGGATQPTLTSTDIVTVNIIEPTVTLVKSVDIPSPAAGQTIRYSVALTAASGVDASSAFDIILQDSLDLGLVYQGNPTVTAGGASNTIGAPTVSGDGITTAQTLTWNASNSSIDVLEGETIIVSYDVLVLNTVLANTPLNNSVLAQWSSLDNTPSVERTGVDGIGGLNDYITAPYVLTVTTPNINATINKVRDTDTYTTATPEEVRVGDIVQYSISVSLGEGTVSNLQIVDTLPKGLQFESVYSIDGATTAPYTAPGGSPFVYTPIPASNIVVAGNASTGPSTVTWNIGDINNQPNDGLPDNFVVVYRARVLNNSVLTQTVLPLNLNNSVTMTYNTALGSVNDSDLATNISVLQPSISINKSVSAAGGDTIIDANEVVTYTVDVVNNGLAPAYDLVLQDILPVGMRKQLPVITVVSANLLVGGAFPLPAFSYDSLTGTITWNLDTGTANTAIPAGDTLRIIYQAQADPDLAAGMILTNAATATLYYSFDNNDVPVMDTITGQRQVYGPSNTAQQTLTTAAAGALQKDVPAVTDVTIGDTFSYIIKVPATPINLALHDVIISDNLAASGADLTLVSLTKLAGNEPWTPSNINAPNLVDLKIADPSIGIDIQPMEQIQIQVTVRVNNAGVNVDGLSFTNTANYTFNQINNNPGSVQNGVAGVSGAMTIVEPGPMTLDKTGPATAIVGSAATYTLSIQNTGNSPAYDATIVDYLPNPTPGGMCATTPNNYVLQMYLADGTTPVGAALVQNTDYTASFVNGSPTCSLTFTMTSTAAAIPAGYWLKISYDAYLDADTPNATALTNIAGVTQWFSLDTNGSGASGQIRTYNETITDGTTGTLDFQAAYITNSQSPQIVLQKAVTNKTTSTTPGSSASPGDVLHYVITATNTSAIPAPNFSITDEIDGLNATPYFVAGSLSLPITAPAAADTSNSNATGGSKGTGLVDVRNLSLGAAGSGSESLTIEFDVTLLPVIDSGVTVLDQAQLQLYSLPPVLSDDPYIVGSTDPTQTVIQSAPQFLVKKTSADITGSSTVLLTGDTLRYTITVQNVGNEDAVNAMLKDSIPANTTYVAGSTLLNGVAVTDVGGTSALVAGMLIHAPPPEDTTPGHMRADASGTTNIATITFNVTINANVVAGTIISNQAFFNADGAGTSGAIAQLPSDDPSTAIVNDPTRNVVGSVPLIDSTKTVTLIDNGTTPGVVDPTDTLRYTITITNFGGVQASGVILTDAVPANTTYVADSVTLNGLAVAVPDAGLSPLIAGIPVSSSDLTPPLPTVGYLSPGGTATVTFDVTVNAVAPGTVISNQGFVDSNEQITEPTDVDGDDSNGDQPTQVVVGNTQQLTITKSLQVVGGGPALAGGQLEYVITVTNIGSVVATNVIIYDDVSAPVAGQKSYVANSARLNGLAAGTSYVAPNVIGDYGNTYGNLAPGQSVELRFTVDLNAALAYGTPIDNTATVWWDGATKSASANASVNIGALPGVANLNGRVWHDGNFNDVFDAGERALANWNVEVYFKGALIGTVVTDANGQYQVPSLPDNYLTSDRYELRFVAPGANATSAKLGMATAPAPFLTGMHRIYDMVLYPGTNVTDLNLPIDPDGVVYNSIFRTPIAGARLTMVNTVTNTVLPPSCFVDSAQQNQVTLADGYYKFDINFTQPECPSGDDYLIRVTSPSGFQNAESAAIPATSNATTSAYSVSTCNNDARLNPLGYCEAQSSELNPGVSVLPGVGTRYYLHVNLNNVSIPTQSQLFNNHIPLDPVLTNALTISKHAAKLNVIRGDLVPYTITVKNTLPIAVSNVSVYDTIPAGFKYVTGSMRINGVAMQPGVNGRLISWNINNLAVDAQVQYTMLLAVSSGVQEGEYVNRVVVYSPLLNANISPEAQATVRVVPDPTFDCSDIVGTVYDDRNRNGTLDKGEKGIAGVRLATVRGLLVTSDKHGRYHISCADVPNEQRGSNFVLKLDARSLPSGYRITSENPAVKTLTRGKMAKINFGATIHHVVTMSVADGAFYPDSNRLRPQWLPRMGIAIDQLLKQDSVLRITYLADVEKLSMVRSRMSHLIAKFEQLWEQSSGKELEIEHEIFWRHGGPVDQDPDDINLNSYINGVLNRDNIIADTEKELPHGFRYTPWMQDPALFDHHSKTKIETRQEKKKRFTTKKLKDVVPPILFKSGKADIPEELVEKLRNILNEMRDKVNVRLHFIGHTDDVKLRGKLAEKYGDNTGLSKERAGTTAEFFQRSLELPPEAISYEGKGETEPVASNKTEAGRRQNRRVEVQVWYDEVSEEMVERQVEVEQASQRIMVCRVETLCKLKYKAGHSRRAKLRHLVPPFHYDEGVSEVPKEYLEQLRKALKFLAGKDNVTMHFIAHTDTTPLSDRDERIYVNQLGLSKAHARRFAIAVQEAMGLPNSAVSSGGKGDAFPVASNNSARGRALNRRIEVEFWHDDPLEDLPDEPQICPESAAAETVERVYNPPEGDIKPIFFEKGQPTVEGNYYMPLKRAIEDIKDKAKVRLRFIGYTSNKRLDRRTAQVYGDDVGLSTARARRAMEMVQQQLGLRDDQVEYEGRGYVQSQDVAQTGFIESEKSKVVVQVIYDELAEVEDSEGISIKRITRDVSTRAPFALNLLRISVDGQPLNDPNKSIPDVSRCTDVALDKAKLQFKFDNMELKPRLNVVAWPNVIATADDPDSAIADNQTHFRMYSNYPSFINKAEVRIFSMDQSTIDKPVAVVALDAAGNASWLYSKAMNPNLPDYRPPRMSLKYLLRVYDKNGNYDETSAQELWLLDKLDKAPDAKQMENTLRFAYGENRLVRNFIPLKGGEVKLLGEQLPPGHKPVFAGQELPVGKDGRFAGEFILPDGLQKLEVAIVDEQGNGYVYQRKISLDRKDWFYLGMADLTVARDYSSSAASQVTGDNTHFANTFSFDGRLAFYAKGKFGNDSKMTISADTREGPLRELFTNFMNKDPKSLFRRIDPNYLYPTYGDDSRVEQDAPTSGKFYIKWEKQHNYAMWGNFKLAYLDNDLAHVDRGLYGGNFNYESELTTPFGERRWKLNLFAASPGTVGGRDEFLATGGSLYFLRHQDILNGSDRMRVEVRDRLSGMVLSVKNLVYGLDYDIDYIQGRVVLSEPLSNSANSGSVVDNNEFGGKEVYLVARYEYTSGFDDLNDIESGGNLSYWLHDRVKLGITMENQEAGGMRNALSAYDLTYRYSASTWVKYQQSHSRGPISSSSLSSDGGYQFADSTVALDTQVKAGAWRGDASIAMKDLFDKFKGRLTFYNQEVEAGYSSPGIQTLHDTIQRGFKVDVPVTEQIRVRMKSDAKTQKDALENKATELNGEYKFNSNWSLASGIRVDSRRDNSALVPDTQQQGERTDMTVRAEYNSQAKWLAYGFTQSTVKVRGNRDDNDRLGFGGSYRLSDRFKLNGEMAGGDLGMTYQLGGEYKLSSASDVYSHYVLENERSDNGMKARKGSLVNGYKHRYSDSGSMYVEEKYTHGDVPSGITHAMGVKLTVTDNLNVGASVDVGKLKDNNTAAETDRKAVAGNLAYKFDRLSFSSSLELRLDNTQLSLSNSSTRKTWLTRNTLKLILSDDWRFLGKLNYSQSISSLGDYYAGNYTELVAGYAYRPVVNDKWIALYKYTYFYNVPTVDQLTPLNSNVSFIQKSHIWSTDLSYDFSSRFSLGGKIAYRLGKVSSDRTNPQFFTSNAALYIARVDWHFGKRWDLLSEVRMLQLPQLGDTRSGLLLGVYRQVGKHFRFGGGYNFTDFSDDLTDQDYNSQGFFINLLGKF